VVFPLIAFPNGRPIEPESHGWDDDPFSDETEPEPEPVPPPEPISLTQIKDLISLLDQKKPS
jgi:hypothetical protein